MDLADYIVKVAANNLKSDCMDRKCTIKVFMHGDRYLREIYVISMTNHVLLQFRSIEFKLSREDKESFNDTVDFLVNEVEDDILKAFNEDIEYDVYWPNDEMYNKNYMTVGKANDIIFSKRFDLKELKKTLSTYLKNMRFLN